MTPRPSEPVGCPWWFVGLPTCLKLKLITSFSRGTSADLCGAFVKHLHVNGSCEFTTESPLVQRSDHRFIQCLRWIGLTLLGVVFSQNECSYRFEQWRSSPDEAWEHGLHLRSTLCQHSIPAGNQTCVLLPPLWFWKQCFVATESRNSDVSWTHFIHLRVVLCRVKCWVVLSSSRPWEFTCESDRSLKRNSTTMRTRYTLAIQQVLQWSCFLTKSACGKMYSVSLQKSNKWAHGHCFMQEVNHKALGN